jgi:putative two-component system response regulator
MAEQTTGMSVLIVDDDANLANAIRRFLEHHKYRTEVADTAEAALACLKTGHFDAAFLDIVLPHGSGIDVLPKALELDPTLAVIMLSGLDDAVTAALCMQRGAIDYVPKPVDLEELRRHLERALSRRDTAIQNQDMVAWLKQELPARTRELDHYQRQLERMSIGTLEALVNALEAKSPYFSGHSVRVAALAATIAAELELSDDDVEAVRTAGRLHDIGMIGVREAVLTKQQALTREEHEHIQTHATAGYRILAPLTHMNLVATWTKHHHEHWSGTGYPDGLEGDAIPLGARILCASEVYDALTTPRPYQGTYSPDQAAKRITELADDVLDPEVADALAGAVSRRKTLFFLREELDEAHTK